MKEKCQIAEQLNKELEQLSEQFEDNWQIIKARDEIIAKLNGELKSILDEKDRADQEAGNHARRFSDMSTNLTNLENRDVQISTNIHNIRNQINNIKFEIQKMKENAPKQQRLPIEDIIENLTKEKEDSTRRIGEAKLLTDQLHSEGTEELTKTEQELASEKQQAMDKLTQSEQKRDTLISTIQNVEAELTTCISHLNSEIRALQTELHTYEDEDDTALITENIALNREIASLTDQIESERRDSIEKQRLIEAIEQRLNERVETSEQEMQQVNQHLEKEEAALDRLKKQLGDQLSKNAQLEASMDEYTREYGEKLPTIQDDFKAQKDDLIQTYSSKNEEEVKKRSEIKQTLRSRVEEIRKLGSECDLTVSQIQKIEEEIRKRLSYVQHEKKKIRSINITIKEFEGELEALKSAADPTIVLRHEHHLINESMNKMRAEMKVLDGEDKIIQDHIRSLELENHSLRDYLSAYEKIKRYYNTHKYLWRKRTQQPPRTGARVVLECGRVEIQAN